jgi:hypothetical protein
VTSSATTTSMSKPEGGKKVPDWTLSYFRQRNKNRVHSLVIEAMKKHNISQAEIARRLGRRTEVVCRWIGAPGNWTLDTISDLLFAIDGLEVDYKTAAPLTAAKRNYSAPDWVQVRSSVAMPISQIFHSGAPIATSSTFRVSNPSNAHLNIISEGKKVGVLEEI